MRCVVDQASALLLLLLLVSCYATIEAKLLRTVCVGAALPPLKNIDMRC